jgi:U2 small nuclear ribonucleoprotein B''
MRANQAFWLGQLLVAMVVVDGSDSHFSERPNRSVVRLSSTRARCNARLDMAWSKDRLQSQHPRTTKNGNTAPPVLRLVVIVVVCHSAMMNQPNATLYIKNIDWKVKKNLLRRALYTLFSRHGKVLEIVALRKDGLRGQAFVVMDGVPAATAALQKEQGFTFFGKDLIIEYAKAKSDRIAKRDGDYVPKAKRQKMMMAKTNNDGTNKQDDEDEDGDKDDDVAESADNEGDGDATAPSAAAVVDEAADAAAAGSEAAPPSKMLLAQGLPTACNEAMLAVLFSRYHGYVEARMPRPGLAFIEFVDEPKATLAMQALNGFQLTPTETLQLGYGKE